MRRAGAFCSFFWVGPEKPRAFFVFRLGGKQKDTGSLLEERIRDLAEPKTKLLVFEVRDFLIGRFVAYGRIKQLFAACIKPWLGGCLVILIFVVVFVSFLTLVGNKLVRQEKQLWAENGRARKS